MTFVCQRFATLSKFLPFMPVFGGGSTRFQPVYAGDVARAVEIASRTVDRSARTATDGKVFEAGGPESTRLNELQTEIQLKYTHSTDLQGDDEAYSETYRTVATDSFAAVFRRETAGIHP